MAVCLIQNPSGNKFTFTTGIGRDDNIFNLGAAQEGGNNFILLSAAL